MAILIKESTDKTITIDGTDLQLTEVYGRIEFVGRADGRTMEIAVAIYTNHATYSQNKPVFTDIPIGNINATLDDTEQQTIDVAHKYAQIAYQQLGYNVEIIM